MVTALKPRAGQLPEANDQGGAIEQARYVCALGAMQTAAAIPRTIPITHCGPGCADKQHNALSGANGYQGGGWGGAGVAPSSNASQREVIFGGTERLEELIEASLKILDADLFVVVTGCIPDLVGDDVGSVVRGFQNRGVPVVYAETGGFRGNNFTGHEVVIRAIIDQLVGPYKGPREQGRVNLWSLLPYQNTFWRGDLEEIKRLLEGIGLRVNVLFGPESAGVGEWRAIPQAQFNLVLSPWLGLETARHLEGKYGQPFLHIPVLPIGAKETGEVLREIAAFAGVEGSAETFIAAEERRYYTYLEAFSEFYSQYRWGLPARFAIAADSTYALALSKFAVRQLGLLPARLIITDNPPEELREAIRAAFQVLDHDVAGEIEFIEDSYLIHERIRTASFGHKPPLIFGSSWERDLARDLKGFLVEVAFPTSYEVVLARSYAGYRGGLALLERIYTTVVSRNA
ncbi:Hydrogenase [Rhodovastum atsumiense]|uniref:Hydrogenase n=1 Tax=Rhodovastum atsumiense TaxID=504468 RepID=A0A5M6IUN3_9PROT|nr:nitrogenase component 1 [Rhodovastum atsumiense]KAA5611996.1 hydrogenase [Rhodovastum atsumiense]CAH2598776.1 Hydrogenase [Rhodovastum atsumiense]